MDNPDAALFVYYTLYSIALLFCLFSLFLFFGNSSIIATIEGKAVAAQKTPADIMIWRIVGLWLACIGLICLFVTDFPTGFWSSRWAFDNMLIKVVWRPLACLLIMTHTIEIGVKWIALNRGSNGIVMWLRGASGNILLAVMPFVGLLLQA